jgi:tetratricopeptide (TPR) repeat protein
MRCNRCGALLNESDICPNCGADVHIYKRIARASNAYYNLGLAKAQVRNLTGAVESLRTALTIDKRNIQARNLLGLVYTERGDIVEGLSQWVISRSIMPTDNLASRYIQEAQKDKEAFDSVTEAISQYNLALRNARQGNTDMAMIQLKKVTAAHPNLLKAQQLLALLYIQNGEYNRARRCLNTVLHVDRSNTLAQRYLQEIRDRLREKRKNSPSGFRPHTEEEKEVPLSGNDVIIPRGSFRMPGNGAATAVHILIGAGLGILLFFLLLTPAIRRSAYTEGQAGNSELTSQIASQDAQITSLQSQLEEVQRQYTNLQTAGGDTGNTQSLIASAQNYLSGRMLESAENLADIEDSSALTQTEAAALYQMLSDNMKSYAPEIYDSGKTAFDAGNYQTAILAFVRAARADSTNAEYVYYAARAYAAAGDVTNAAKYYQMVVDRFPASEYATEAKGYLTGANAAAQAQSTTAAQSTTQAQSTTAAQTPATAEQTSAAVQA